MSDMIARHPHPKDGCPICADEIGRLRAESAKAKEAAIGLAESFVEHELAIKSLSAKLAAARKDALEEAESIALAIDSERGNEKEIAKAIRALSKQED